MWIGRHTDETRTQYFYPSVWGCGLNASIVANTPVHSTYHVPGTVLSILHVITHLNPDSNSIRWILLLPQLYK